MQLVKVEQGTKEWHELRAKNMTASDASAMMGVSKYKSRNQLLQEKKFGVKEVITPAKQALFNKGHETEAQQRDLIEIDLIETFAPVVCVTDVDGVGLLASLDGLSEDGKTIFEHKLWNATLAENVSNNVLEESHYWQLEHQLLVAEADAVLFVVSDGTRDKREMMYYGSAPERREKLIAGWKQFAEDMVTFEMEAKQELVIADSVQLPVITCSVNGSQIVTNLDSCLVQIKEIAQIEMSRELSTDQDFANKDQLNKDVKKVRAELKDRVAKVKGEFVSYSEFEALASELDSVLQKMQSHGEKQVKDAKEDKKLAIINDARLNLQQYIFGINDKIAPMSIHDIININPDFAGAMKSKRTIESLHGGVDDVLAACKVEINQVVERVIPNLEFLRENASEYKFLFMDARTLVNQEAEPFKAVVTMRITEHKQQEAIKLEEQRKQIQAEEEAKAKAKAILSAKAEMLIQSWKDLLEVALNSDDPIVTGGVCKQIGMSNCDKNIFLDDFDNALSIYDDCYTQINSHHSKVVSKHNETLEAQKKSKQPEVSSAPVTGKIMNEGYFKEPEFKALGDSEESFKEQFQTDPVQSKKQNNIPIGLLDDLAEWSNRNGLTLMQTEQLENILNKYF